MLGITRLEPDGPPAPLYPPGYPQIHDMIATMTKFSCIQALPHCRMSHLAYTSANSDELVHRGLSHQPWC